MELLKEVTRRFLERRSYVILLACFSFIIGIVAHSFVAIKFEFFWIYNLLLLFVVFIFIFWQDKKIHLILLGVFFIVLGFARFNFGIEDNYFTNFISEKENNFVGTVVSEPINKIDKQQLIIKINGVDRERILLTTSLYPKYKYGDLLQFDCKLKKPIKFEDFDYARYLSIQNIYGLCYYPNISIISTEAGITEIKYLLNFKNNLINKLNTYLNEPQASFLSGLILGARNAIPPKLLLNFNRTGTTNIIAISGWNITFLGAMFMPVLFILGLARKKAFYVMIVIIFLYSMIAGFTPPVVRAAIMGVIALYAMAFSRYNHAGRALLYSIVIMFLINAYIIYDVGFHLSVAATFGLIYFAPVVRSLLYLDKIKLKELREVLETTISAVIFTLPISLYVFGSISLWALPVNILILPFITYAIIFAISALPISLFLPFIYAKILFLPSTAILSFVVMVINFFGNLPFGYINFRISFWFAILLYILLLIFTFKKLQKLDAKF